MGTRPNPSAERWTPDPEVTPSEPLGFNRSYEISLNNTMTTRFMTATTERGRNDHWTVRQTFIVNVRNGLHARPCALLVKTLRPFRCRAEVEANGEKANGQSIMGLMVLAAGYGTPITFTLTGEDAGQAMAAVSRLFDTRFEDAYQSSPTAAGVRTV